ncbi:sigma-70 family RNA polymerase sigma factor [Brevibacillus formosus]|uniref:ECF RNA polymerase sigma factor SigW n=1 Tax=Brevibacillus formosus TaxID=54913 RepID=A0ABQ0T0J2_9BACL|nr:sigma-70 family RNA polymerase sigma factor [Brevibacillus formosus]MED1956497.1 sigma-70 family RNA polymerase sigma factor [Brevibacillus formosus]GED56886.1 ECF RNA polymerase sigma factor SigW [Brevibacillus formosus]
MKQPNYGKIGVNKGQQGIESIIDQVKSGHIQKYSVVIQKFEKKIYTYCYCILKNREEAKDAVQEIFIKAYQDIERYENRLSFSAWLYKIAYHHCLDQIRKQSRWQKVVSLYMELQTRSHFRLNQYTLVDELLSSLNREERNILLLKVVEQYTFEEMAEIMSCNSTTLRKKFERLRKKLLHQKNQERGIGHEEIASSN